jgi:hypothetical protein
MIRKQKGGVWGRSPQEKIPSHFIGPAGLLYLSCGQAETAEHVDHGPGLYQVRSQLAANRRMQEILLQAGYDVIYSEFEGGHNVRAWRADLPHGLKALLVR